MGCCGSKSDGHEPLLTDEQHNAAHTGVESTYIAEPIAIDSFDKQSIGQSSFTSSFKPSMQPSASFQRRQIQAEHAKRVIERAEEDMIDITQSALDMEQEDPSEAAAQLYISNMRSTRVDARQVKDTPPSWFPAASAPGKAPLATHATEASSARARKVATRVATAFLSSQVPLKKVQRITATFTSPA